jgi:hypothetical protein
MAGVCGAVIGALGLGVAVAAPNYTFVEGQKLSSAQMTENFADLQYPSGIASPDDATVPVAV